MNKSPASAHLHIRTSPHLFYYLFLITYSLLTCCSNNGYHKTSSGLQYKIYTSNKGAKAKEGDYLTMYLVYKAPDDSVLFDSHKDGAPWHFQLMSPPFHGSYEEGLTLLAAGDSATFLVSADSMFNIVFKKPLPNSIPAGSKLKFDVKLEKIETPQEAILVKRKMDEEMRKSEQKEIDQYLKMHNLQITPTASGLYFMKNIKSTGVAPSPYGVCVIEYTGRFLSGKVFESSDLDKHPKQITLGQQTVIKGLEEAILMMKTGEKATIIVPSKLAYGEEGRRNPTNGTYDIYPYTSLVYEITLRAVD